jgi:3-dehydroquinate dehydratase-1
MLRAMPAALAIGSLVLGARPRIAVPFTDQATRADVAAAVAAGCDVAELRVDLFSAFATEHVLAQLPTFAGVPTIATIRHGDEGGGWRGSEAERLALYRALLPSVGAIDVEIASEIGRAALAAARDAGRLAIGSFHDFAKTPAPDALAEVVARGRALGADVVKIAATVADAADLRALARLLLEPDEIGLIVIGMGPRGAASRVLFPLLGSLVTYATTGTRTAPGQLPLAELIDLLRRF